jgi:putative transcriptional regulator
MASDETLPSGEVFSEFDGEAQKRLLAPGALLLARDLNDPNFSSTVVLLCQHGRQGSYGLVLNRPSHMPLREVFDQVPENGAAGKSRKVYVGGPVQPGELQILMVGSEPPPGSMALASEVHLGGAWEELEEILNRDPQVLRLFLGYSGWGAGQLENELEMGAWEVHQTDLKKFLQGPEDAWFRGAAEFKRHLKTL